MALLTRAAAVAAASFALLLPARSAEAQERVPAEPIPVEGIADPAAVPDTTAPIALPGVETIVDAEEEGGPWELDPDGFRGVILWRYSRVDGAVPAVGLALRPRDPRRWPAVEGRIGLATTHSRVYGELAIRQRLPLGGREVGSVRVEWGHRSTTFDDWKLSRRENDLATFFVGSDQMAWWRERGWTLALALESEFGERALEASLHALEQFSQEERSPFVLFGDGDFPENPAIEEGDLRSAVLRYVHDTRDVQSPLLPAPGWVVEVASEGAVGAFGGDLEFLRGFADVRRYQRFGDDAWWDHRLVVHSGTSLPPQRRARLGGPGSLRGFRAGAFVSDRFALQATSEARLPLPVYDWIAPLFLSWHAVGFADAGTVDEDLETWHANVGVGLSGINIFSYVGVFVAQRVTDLDGDDTGPRVIVRLRRDF